MEKGRIFETFIGFLILFIAGGFFYYVYNKSNWNVVQNGYSLYAKFEKIDGISEGSDIKISGVKIGKVINITLDNQTFLAVVKISVSNSIKIPSDSSASVTSEGLFGGKYISITPGGEEKHLKDGESIDKTFAPINLEKIIGSYMFNQNKQ